MPTPTQELLLRAALAPADESTRALAAWRSAIGDTPPMSLDVGSQRLLPLLYRRHQLPEHKALQRRAWATNTLLLQTLAEVVVSLRAVGIELLVLKGAALAQRYYGDVAARPMSDLDVLLRASDVPRAIATLEAEGWLLERPIPAWVGNPATAPIGHGWAFARADQAIDLHWFAIPQSCQPDADRALWEHSEPLVVGDVTTRTPSATEHLLHTLAHGVMFNPVAPIRWVADALMLTRHTIDWSRLLHETLRRGLLLAVREPLAWLVQHFAVDAPILLPLEAVPPKLIDRWRYQHALHPWNDRESLPHLWMDWWRFAEGRPLRDAPAILERYCHYRWGARSIWHISLRRLGLTAPG